jgi:hypothetical protein
MKLRIQNYEEQNKEWPQTGQHIMAQYDDNEIIVYQAYKPEIGLFAAENQFFGGPFSLTRMTWIKPNFLWIMYRNGWGQKDGQEITLAIHLKRSAFEKYIEEVIYSNYSSDRHATREDWQEEVKSSNARLQWDPDHDPYGAKLLRRAIQIGLRNELILSFAKEDIIEIEDISDYVSKQFEHVKANKLDLLETPAERPFKFKNEKLNLKLGLD